MLLLDFSSILHRIANGSLHSIKHIRTSTPHGKQVNDTITNESTFTTLGTITYIFDEYNFVFEMLGVNYYTQPTLIPETLNVKNIEFIKAPGKIKDTHYKYPVKSFQRTFISVLFNNITNLHEKFGTTDTIICLDSPENGKYWRHTPLPSYKGNRKETKSNNPIDWASIYNLINTRILPVFDKLTNCSVLGVKYAEGDDVVYTLAKLLGNTRNVVVISEDKDLQVSSRFGIKMYRPMVDKFGDSFNEKTAELFIKEHCIKGDVSDNITPCSLESRFSPEFISWINKTHGIELTEFELEFNKHPQFDEFVIEYMKQDKRYRKYTSTFCNWFNGKAPKKDEVRTPEQLARIKSFGKQLTIYHELSSKFNKEEIKEIHQEFYKENPNEYIKALDDPDFEENYFKVERKNTVYKVYDLGPTGIKKILHTETGFKDFINSNPILQERFDANRILIDMENIPTDLVEKILLTYKNIKVSENSKAFKQFLEFYQVANLDVILNCLCSEVEEELVEW